MVGIRLLLSGMPVGFEIGPEHRMYGLVGFQMGLRLVHAPRGLPWQIWTVGFETGPTPTGVVM